MMKKGYYYFGECGRMEKILSAAGIISAIVSVFFLFKGGYLPLINDDSHWGTYNAWCLFFFLLSIFAFTANLCIHKICRDIATLLKEVEENKEN